jgi:acetyl esterase/lipase
MSCYLLRSNPRVRYQLRCEIDATSETRSKAHLAVYASLYHGGAFTVGASSDLAHHQVQWYLRQGFAVVSPEYRLVPQWVFVSALRGHSACTETVRQRLHEGYSTRSLGLLPLHSAQLE